MNHTTTTNRIRHRIAAATTAALIVATGLAFSAAPASAATPSQYGAGWLTRNSTGTVTSWSSTGAKPTLSGAVNGRFTATFPGITGGFGTPSVTPGNEYAGAMCSIDSYPVVAGNLTVTFHCANVASHAITGDFTVSYTSITGAAEGWVDANQPGFDGTYDAKSAYDWAGVAVTIAHNPDLAGEYRVTFPGGVAGPTFGSGMVTPVTTGTGHCTAAIGVGTAATEIDVYCFDAQGAPKDMRFVAHFVGKRAVLATTAPKSGWALYPGFGQLGQFMPTAAERFTSNGQKVTIDHRATGAYTFLFKHLGGAASMAAQADVEQGPGTGDVRCGAVASTKGADALVTVNCTNTSGAPTDTAVGADYFGF